MKTTRIFHLKVSHFLVEKNSVYLNRHVFGMVQKQMRKIFINVVCFYVSQAGKDLSI